MEKRRPRVGDAVIYHDNKGTAHNALVVIAWDHMHYPMGDDTDVTKEKPVPKYALDDLTDLPCLNLCYVLGDDRRKDDYGRQTEKPTSVPHGEEGCHVHGYYWRYSWETPIAYREPSES